MAEKYPDGKRLWLAVCDVRDVESQRAELEWMEWEDGFLTQGEWQRVAERFLASGVKTSDALRQLRDAVDNNESRDNERQPRIAAALRVADAALGVKESPRG